MRKEEGRRANCRQMLRKKILGTRHALNCPECTRDADAFVWRKSKDARRYSLPTLGRRNSIACSIRQDGHPSTIFVSSRNPVCGASTRKNVPPEDGIPHFLPRLHRSQKSNCNNISFRRITSQAFPPRELPQSKRSRLKLLCCGAAGRPARCQLCIDATGPHSQAPARLQRTARTAGIAASMHMQGSPQRAELDESGARVRGRTRCRRRAAPWV